MSASTSPVATPRKGKHVRSGVSTISQSTQFGQETTGRLDGITSLPLGVDLNTLDPDDAFVKLSIREIQNIEASLQANHDQLSQMLKSLVAERYRDMLGTANTLIEMSSSASNLVARLDAVREGVSATKSSTNEPQEKEESNLLPHREVKQNVMVLKADETSEILSVAAATKLLAEAPDEIWRAIEEATDSPPSVPSAQFTRLAARRLANMKAADTLKAAILIVLCQKTWEWLSTLAHRGQLEAVGRFPYIASQWKAVESMRERVSRVAQQGLAGWLKSTIDHNQWEELSSSYIASLTYMLANALLQGSNLSESRRLLLQARQKAILEQLDNRSVRCSHTLARSVRCISDTMTHCVQAFSQPRDKQDMSHLASVFEAIDRGAVRQSVQFPPQAVDIIDLLPSGDVLAKFLPDELLKYAPKMSYQDDMECQRTTLQVLQAWCDGLSAESFRTSYRMTIDRIETISAIGETQIQIRESLDKSMSMIDKTIENVDVRDIVAENVQSVVKLVEELLLGRADVLCRNRTAELSLAISESTSSASKSLHPERRQTNGVKEKKSKVLEIERVPILFALGSDVPNTNMQRKLRLCTPLVHLVLSSVEERAQILSKEMTSYTAYIEKDAAKRKRRQGSGRERIGHLEDIEKQIAKVMNFYRNAFDSARLLLVDELKSQLQLRQGDSDEVVEQHDVQNLLIARIASALQKSEVLRSTTTIAANSNDEVFLQRLAALRSDIINDWVVKMIDLATLSYRTKAKLSIKIYTDDQNQGRPSTALAESLLRLVDCIEAIGCGYQSEIRVLGKQIFIDFVRVWLKEADQWLEGNSRHCFVFDSQVLLTLMREHTGVEEEVKELSSICQDDLISTEMQEQTQVAIHRLRLILHPFRSSEQTSQHLNRDKAPSQSVSAPPLPMLTLVAARDRVPLF